jgi:hypothetical protein
MFSKNYWIVPVKYKNLYTICFRQVYLWPSNREQARSHRIAQAFVGASLLAKMSEDSAQDQPLPILGHL